MKNALYFLAFLFCYSANAFASAKTGFSYNVLDLSNDRHPGVVQIIVNSENDTIALEFENNKDAWLFENQLDSQPFVKSAHHEIEDMPPDCDAAPTCKTYTCHFKVPQKHNCQDKIVTRLTNLIKMLSSLIAQRQGSIATKLEGDKILFMFVGSLGLKENITIARFKALISALYHEFYFKRNGQLPENFLAQANPSVAPIVVAYRKWLK